MPATATAPPGLSGPLSAVLRSLDGPDGLPPAVAAAAHVLAAEQLTAEAEACYCATAPGGLCSECQARSESAAACRMLADDLGLIQA